MRIIYIAGLASLFLAFSYSSQIKEYELSNEPQSKEEIAIYRIILENYLAQTHKAKGTLRLANHTGPFVRINNCSFEFNSEVKGFPRERGKGIMFDKPKGAPSTVRQLSDSVISGLNVVLVEPDRSDRQTSDTGLFTLSEIVFDKRQEHALVSYEFYKTLRSGHGETLIFKKVEGEWKNYLNICVWLA